MAVSDRTFGVEIECTYGAPPTGKSDVYQRIGWGARDPMRQRAIKEIGAHKDFKRWAENIGIDGSGIEIRSPILKGQEGIEELAAFFDFLNEKESTVTNQDGMHVHHGAKDFASDWVSLYNACASWGHWTEQIHSMVAKRRRNGGMCPDAFNNPAILKRLEDACLGDQEEREKLVKKYNDQLRRYYTAQGSWPSAAPARDPASIGGRGAFNLANVTRGKGTIEIRLAEGMMDRDCAVAWVKFGQAFLDHIKETGKVIDGRPKKDLDTLLDKIGLDNEAQVWLKAKAANKGNALSKAAKGRIANGVNFDDTEDE